MYVYITLIQLFFYSTYIALYVKAIMILAPMGLMGVAMWRVAMSREHKGHRWRGQEIGQVGQPFVN